MMLHYLGCRLVMSTTKSHCLRHWIRLVMKQLDIYVNVRIHKSSKATSTCASSPLICAKFKIQDALWMTIHCCVCVLCVIRGCGGDYIINLGRNTWNTNTNDNYSIFERIWGMPMKQVHDTLFMHDNVDCGPHYRDVKGITLSIYWQYVPQSM